MKKLIFNAWLLLVAVTLSKQSFSQNKSQQSIKRPNIILFFVDDMGWTDTSVPFADVAVPNNKKYETPSMQRLANMGVRFTNAYAQPVCTPSRISLMTGMSTGRHRVTNWTNNDVNMPTDAEYPGIRWPDWNYNGLATSAGIKNTVVADPFPALLKKAGYYTSIVGKGHFAPFGVPASDPQNIGFIESIAADAGGHPRNYFGTKNFGNKERYGYTFGAGIRGLEQYHGEDIFLTEALTLEAIKSMEKARNLSTPFFLYMSHYAVHTPIVADPRFYQKYIDKGLNEIEAKYASLVEGMDKSLGDIMDYLKNKGIADNTIILFISDNGGLALTPPRKGGEPFKENFPLKSGKGSLYEGGIREPMIAYWPGVTKAGTKSAQNVVIEDFYPTILEMAGVKNYKLQQQLDGVSFVNYLKDNNLINENRSIVWHAPTSWGQGEGTLKKNYPEVKMEDIGMGPASAIKKGDWKLIHFYGTGKTELYNVKNDIGEEKNVAKSNPAKVKELFDLLSKSLKEQGAQFPINAQTNQPIFPVLSSSK